MKKMKKLVTKFLSVGLVLAMLLAMASCGSSDSGSADDGKVYKIIVNTPQAAQASTTVALVEACDKITEASDGRIEFEIHDSGTLLGMLDAFTGVQDGLADITFVAANMGYDYLGISSRLTMLPFMGYESGQQAYDIYQTLRGEYPELDKEFEDNGLVNLGVFFNEGTNLYFKGENVNFSSVDDLKGMKVGVADKFLVDYLKEMGGTPVFTTNADIYTNIDNGVVDAVLQHPLIFQVTGCADLLNTVVEFGDSGIMRGSSMMIMNKNTYDGLPEDLQQILKDGFAEYCQTAQDIQINDSKAFNQSLADKGAEFITLTDDQIAGFKDLSVGVKDDCIKGLEDMGYENAQEIYDRIQELIKTTN